MSDNYYYITVSHPAGALPMKSYKVKEIIRIIERDGWYLVIQEGSHRQYKHPEKKGRVTVAGKPGQDVPIGTLHSIFRQAGIKPEN